MSGFLLIPALTGMEIKEMPTGAISSKAEVDSGFQPILRNAVGRLDRKSRATAKTGESDSARDDGSGESSPDLQPTPTADPGMSRPLTLETESCRELSETATVPGLPEKGVENVDEVVSDDLKPTAGISEYLSTLFNGVTAYAPQPAASTETQTFLTEAAGQNATGQLTSKEEQWGTLTETALNGVTPQQASRVTVLNSPPTVRTPVLDVDVDGSTADGKLNGRISAEINAEETGTVQVIKGATDLNRLMETEVAVNQPFFGSNSGNETNQDSGVSESVWLEIMTGSAKPAPELLIPPTEATAAAQAGEAAVDSAEATKKAIQPLETMNPLTLEDTVLMKTCLAEADWEKGIKSADGGADQPEAWAGLDRQSGEASELTVMLDPKTVEMDQSQCDALNENDGFSGNAKEGAGSIAKPLKITNFAKPGNTQAKVELLATGDALVEKSPLVREMETAPTTASSSVNRVEVINQIVEKINLMFHNGSTEMDLDLQPENLGKIQLKVVLEGQVITASFVTKSESVKEIIETNLAQLRKTFEDNGIQVQDLMVAVDQGGGDNAGSYASDRQNGQAAGYRYQPDLLESEERPDSSELRPDINYSLSRSRIDLIA